MTERDTARVEIRAELSAAERDIRVAGDAWQVRQARQVLAESRAASTEAPYWQGRLEEVLDAVIGLVDELGDRVEATRPDAVWDDSVPPGGAVCAAPVPGLPRGICGMPVESEPCPDHGTEVPA